MTSDRTLQMWWWQQVNRLSLNVFLPEAILNQPSTGRKTKCELMTRMIGSAWVLLPLVLIQELKNFCQCLFWILWGWAHRKYSFASACVTGCKRASMNLEDKRCLFITGCVFSLSDSWREAHDLQYKKERRWHVHLCGYQHGWRAG